MTSKFRTLFACCAAGALAISLAGCGPDDGSAASSQLMAADSGLEPGWSMMDLAGVDPAFVGDDSAALPEALPMAASYSGGDYAYAPSYDYAPDREDSDYAPLDDSYYYGDGYQDDGYYEDGYYDGGYYDAGSYDEGYRDDGFYNLGNDTSDYALLALAVSLAGVLGDSPPDYGYRYDDVSPWAWQTGDGYYRYAEPIHDGYRYYYYQPGGHRPFLVSDPYYSYGYRDDRLVAIYDRGGRRVDARRAELQLHAAKAYYARADRLYEAAQRDRYGVPAPLWARQRGTIARDRDRWYREQAERPAWQRWETRNQPKLYRQWTNEALVRRDAERGFDGWQRADYRTPPPAFYTADTRRQQVRQIAELRRDRADEVAERRNDWAEKRAAQQRETQALAQRAERAREQRVRQLAERREQPTERRERGIAISDIRERADIGRDRPSVTERIAERREQRAAVARPKEQPRAVAQRIERTERERPARAAAQAKRPEPPKARAAAARPVAAKAASKKVSAPQPRQQAAKAAAPERQRVVRKAAQPQQQVRAERPKAAAPQRAVAKREAPQRQQQVRREQPKAEAPKAPVAKRETPQRPQAAVVNREPRQQAQQARREQSQAAAAQRTKAAEASRQARQEQTQQRQATRAVRQQPERPLPQTQARAPRAEPRGEPRQAQAAPQRAAQPERQQRTETRQAARQEKQDAQAGKRAARQRPDQG